MKRRFILGLVLVLGAIGFGVASCSNFGEVPSGERLKVVQKSPNYDAANAVFANQERYPLKTSGSSFAMLRRYLFGDEVRRPPERLPEAPGLTTALQQKSDGMRFAWLGHSSILLELAGQRLLLDPVFNDASPFPIGGSRFQSPVVPLSEIQDVDVVVISHDHYDHLDREVIQALMVRDHPPTFLVPLGVGAHLEYWGVPVERIVELDWWQNARIGGIDYTATPARHFSGRTLLFSTRKTLWASWAIKSGDTNIYFSGDTGYGKHFKAAGQRLGPFDLTFIDGGQYSENWKQSHNTPEEAVQAHQDLKGEHLMVMHWGMFTLSFHNWFDPIERATRAAKRQGVKIIAPIIGEMVTLEKAVSPPTSWWAALMGKE